MCTVALVGADGAGKTSICGQLARTLPFRTRYVYMGINPGSGNVLLPTTRLVVAVRRWRTRGATGAVSGARSEPARPAAGALRRATAGVRSWLRLANWLAEEWFRGAVVWCLERRGYVVLLDRHFLADRFSRDIAGDGAGRPLSSRIHGFLLMRVYPKPDLTICLDAPADVLFARKHEGTLETLESARRDCLRLGELVRQFAVVDASRPQDEVTRDVAALVTGLYESRKCGPAACRGARALADQGSRPDDQLPDRRS